MNSPPCAGPLGWLRPRTAIVLAVLAGLAFMSSLNLGSAAHYFDWRSEAVSPVGSLLQAHPTKPQPLPPTAQTQPQRVVRPQPQQPQSQQPQAQPRTDPQSRPDAQPLARLAASAVKAEAAAATAGCQPDDGTAWHPAPLGGNGLNQMIGAVHLARYANLPTPVVGCPKLSAADSASWDLADQLVASVPQSVEDLQMEEEMAKIDRAQREKAAKEPSPPPPPPPVKPSPPPPPPPPPCAGNAEECLFQLMLSMPVYDYSTGKHVTPQEHHIPPEDSEVVAGTPQWDEAGTIWSCRGQDCGAPVSVASAGGAPDRASEMLRRMWDAWEPTLERELRADECTYPHAAAPRTKAECAAVDVETAAVERHKAEVAAARMTVLATDGRASEQHAIEEVVKLMIEPNTVKFLYEPCWRRCGGEGPACEYCGVNLCCRKNWEGRPQEYPDLCEGRGGATHVCTPHPAITSNATASAEYARALAARLILAKGAKGYPSPFRLTQLDVELGLTLLVDAAVEAAAVVSVAAGGEARGAAPASVASVAGAAAPGAAAVPKLIHSSAVSSARVPAPRREPPGCEAGGLTRKGASRWLSCGELAAHHGGDLEKPGALEAAVAARAWVAAPGARPELVLTYANEIGSAWVANLVLSLRAVGIDHSLIVSTAEQHCDALYTSPQVLSRSICRSI